MSLPVALPHLESLIVVDYGDEVGDAVVGASGVAILEFGQVPDGDLRLVDRLVVSSDAPAVMAAVVYVGERRESNVRDATQAGNSDVADEASPIVVRAGEVMSIAWVPGSGVSPASVAGATCTGRIQYRVMQRRAAR